MNNIGIFSQKSSCLRRFYRFTHFTTSILGPPGMEWFFGVAPVQSDCTNCELFACRGIRTLFEGFLMLAKANGDGRTGVEALDEIFARGNRNHDQIPSNFLAFSQSVLLLIKFFDLSLNQ